MGLDIDIGWKHCSTPFSSILFSFALQKCILVQHIQVYCKCTHENTPMQCMCECSLTNTHSTHSHSRLASSSIHQRERERERERERASVIMQSASLHLQHRYHYLIKGSLCLQPQARGRGEGKKREKDRQQGYGQAETLYLHFSPFERVSEWISFFVLEALITDLHYEEYVTLCELVETQFCGRFL